MPASVFDTEIPDAVTVFALPTFLSLKVLVELKVNTSLAILLSVYVTVAVVFALYTLFDGVIPMVSDRFVMSAVVVAEELTV